MKDPHFVWTARAVILGWLTILPAVAAAVVTIIYAASCCYQNSPAVKDRRDMARGQAAGRLHEAAMQQIRTGYGGPGQDQTA